MRPASRNIRRLKKEVEELLRREDFAERLDRWKEEDPRKIINPLFSFFCSADPVVRWHAITAAGVVVAHLAEMDPESARVIMRRFLWSLNDESGGIGWGVPEAFGEALARSRLLGAEYGRLLLSFLKEDENYLEHAPLREGALWGMARFAEAWPEDAVRMKVQPEVFPLLLSPEPVVRGLALWILASVGNQEAVSRIEPLKDDSQPLVLYRNERFCRTTVGALAKEALAKIRERNISPR